MGKKAGNHETRKKEQNRFLLISWLLGFLL